MTAATSASLPSSMKDDFSSIHLMKTLLDLATASAIGFIFIAILYGDRTSVLLRPFLPSPAFIRLQGVTVVPGGGSWAKNVFPKLRSGASQNPYDSKEPDGDMRNSLSWMQLGRLPPAYIQKKKDCDRLKSELRLPISQVRNCKRYWQLMTGVEMAANLSMMACLGVSKHQPWDCSSLLKAPQLGTELRRPTKEQAFVHALSSAALVWVISKYCATGVSSNCSCAPQQQAPPPANDMDHDKQLQELQRRQRNVDHQFHQSGCSEDIAFATNFAQRWTDLIAPGNRAKRLVRSDDELVKMHNNAVGREVASALYKHNCKCHGMSASCATQTCWYSLPNSFTPLAERIKDMWINEALYLPQAIQLPSAAALAAGESPQLSNFRKLVYNQYSPDYCKYDPSSGTSGTHGRQCHLDNSNRNASHCSNLCCSRGYDERVETVMEPCQCKVVCCWKVDCKGTCRRSTSKYFCR